MTVVVTGAAGHLGANLIRALIEAGRDVRAMVHEDRRALQGLRCTCVDADVRDVASLHRAFAGAQVVYHLAGHISILMSDWPIVDAINVLGTRNVAQACLECGVRRLVHFSSIQAMQQQPRDQVLDETRPLVTSPKAPPYARSKAAGELQVRAAMERGLDAVILSPSSVIGPHDYRPSHFGQALLAIVNGEMPALVRGGVDWVDARDVAECAMRAEQLAPAGSKYIVSGHWVSVRDLAHMASEITSARLPAFTCPLPLVQVVAPFAVAVSRLRRTRATFTSVMVHMLQGCRTISHARASRELGYAPRALRITLEDTLAWFAQQGRLKRRLR